MGFGKLVFGFFTQEQITAWFSLSSHVVGSNHKWTDPTTSRGNTVLTVQLIHAHVFLQELLSQYFSHKQQCMQQKTFSLLSFGTRFK